MLKFEKKFSKCPYCEKKNRYKISEYVKRHLVTCIYCKKAYWAYQNDSEDYTIFSRTTEKDLPASLILIN